MSKVIDDIMEHIRSAGVEELNELQIAAFEAADKDTDIVLSAPTGTGKTLAFLAILLRIIPEPPEGTFSMIVTPTRELALQITGVFKSMKTGYKVTTCYGGHKREIEEKNLIESPALIVGTPGRIGDHIRRGNIKTETIRLLVLDEFDKSLEMGFAEEMEFIMQSLPGVRKKVLCSATPLQDIPDYVNLSKTQILDFSGMATPQLKLHILPFGDFEQKDETLFEALCTIGNRRTIIFANEKETVRRVRDFLQDRGIATVSYHGSMEQQERETSIIKFRNGTNLFLVTTDLASRGLDISNVRFIIHYDLPESEQVFIHRNGRTARMEASGDAIVMVPSLRALPSFISPDSEIFRLLPGRPLPDMPDWATLFISAGRKDKINKIDIAGFLMHEGGLKKEDAGLIEVKDFYSFAAVRRSKMNMLLGKGRDQRIKNKKVRISAAN